MTQPPGAGAAAAATPGALLASARQASGLSVAEVAVQMRISPRQVQAIEADQYEQLPGAVFVRGFVRNYARLLKLDPIPLLHALEPALGQEAPLRAHEIAGTLPVPARHGHTRLWVGVLLLLVVAVLGAAAYEMWRARPLPSAAPVTGVKEPAATAQPGRPEMQAEQRRAEPVPLAPERLADTPVKPPEAGAPGVTNAATASAPAPDGATPAGAASSTARLTIEFVKDSWIEIRDRHGAIVFMGTGAAGTARRLEAAPPAQVVIGNASGVRITYNERPVDVAAHAARNIARFTLE